MKLYAAWASTYSQKAILAFYEKGIDFELETVNLMDPESRKAYREIYPIGKVPLLKDGDWQVPESSIIVEYLENHYPDSGTKLIPDDPHDSRKTRFMDRMNDLYVSNSIGSLFFESQKPEDKQDSAMIEKYKGYLDTCYQWLNMSLENNTWQMGDNFTLADLSLVGPLFYAEKVYPYSDYSNIVAYKQRLFERDSVKKLMENVIPAVQSMM